MFRRRHAGDFWRRPSTAGEFWRRSLAAGDLHRTPLVSGQPARRKWKAIFIRYGSRRGGFVQTSGDDHLELLDESEIEFGRIACSRWISNGVQLKSENLLIVVGPEVIVHRVTAVAQFTEALPSPSCVRVEETLSPQPRSMAGRSVQQLDLGPQPSTVHSSPSPRSIDQGYQQLSAHIPLTNPRSKAVCGVVFVRDSQPPRSSSPPISSPQI
jgi:hypothetical protein